MDEWVEVGPDGVLAGCTIVYVPFIDPMTGVQRTGSLRLRPASASPVRTPRSTICSTPTEPEQIGVGKRVEAVFKPREERTGSLADIRHFRMVGTR